MEQAGWSAAIRSCAACRARAPRDLLLRFVAQADSEPRKVVFDPSRTMAGRGLNLGPSPECLARAIKRGALQRRLRSSVSREDGELLALATGEALRARLGRYLASAYRRGALVEVASRDEISPPEARVLWDSGELSEVVSGVPASRATTPRIAAKIKALTCAVSEFTFTRASGMKRRPETPKACEALERCRGGALRGHVMTRHERVGPEPSASGPGR